MGSQKVFLAILSTLLAAVGAAAQTGQQASAEDHLRTELEPKIKQAISDGKLPGLAIGVVKNGKLIYAQGFGVAKMGTNTAVTSRSLFHMASVTKTFVAT